jgi:hypothetical protein
MTGFTSGFQPISPQGAIVQGISLEALPLIFGPVRMDRAHPPSSHGFPSAVQIDPLESEVAFLPARSHQSSDGKAAFGATVSVASCGVG